MIRILLVSSCLLLCGNATGQPALGGGVAFESPLLFSKAGGGYNHYSWSPAIRAMFEYRLPNNAFSPGITLSVAPYTLPVSKIGYTNYALLMKFFTINAMLYAKIVKKVANDRQVLIGLGIGATYLKGTGIGISGDRAQFTTAYEDSAEYIKAIMPQVNLSIEYRLLLSPNKKAGAGIGANLIYSYYTQRSTTWRIDVVDANYYYYKLNPELTGHMLNPGIYALLYYQFDKSNR